MQATKTALFGGALACAGIANASTFEFDNGFRGFSSYAFSAVNALIPGDRPGGSNYGYANDTTQASIQFTSGDWSAASTVGDSVITAAVSSGPLDGVLIDANTLAIFEAYVRPTTDITIGIMWDFTDEGVDSGSLIDIFAPDDFSDSFFVDAGAGATTLDLKAGVLYKLEASVSIRDIEGSKAFAEITIPAPGGAALAGIAGLAFVRRRR